MRAAAITILASLALCAAAATPPWLLAARETTVTAGQPFELVLVSGEEPAPDELEVRVRTDIDERVLPLRAIAPAEGARRRYRVELPVTLSGPAVLELVGRESSALRVLVLARPDAVQALTGAVGPLPYEPPLSEEEPIYFIVGANEGWSARFQLSFKYRLFDLGSGFGRERPWLSGLYFGYTQNSLWDLGSDSKAFRDTSYRPSVFWRWQREDEKTLLGSLRLGVEHESNGRDGPRSRSINIAFVRPEIALRFANRHELQFTPRFYAYLDRDENPDIAGYRGHVDWRVRYDAAGDWLLTLVGRRGTLGKGSVQLDYFWRLRDLRVGPVGGYLMVQYFQGYGEDILGYNVERAPQLRVGFAIVP